jgi:hypothetical protein
VAHTVGPVLEQKLESLRGEFRKVRKTFDNELQKSKAYPSQEVKLGQMDHRQWASLKTYHAHRELVEKLFELRVLDPAMGSGHFLVETVDFITDRLLKFLNQFPINPVTFALDRTRASIMESLGEQGVTVDPVKLTDINLLKRHVLKRCVYGVDLNPMAVELAKVSLWLDAFTLGAPLNFLDHHLRCGNALIGATFKDLQAATRSRLFGIDYEPLLRAILHVLKVNKMADATAAEVRQSASEYDHARAELSGYQIVLDLLVAKHFGYPKAPGLLEHGDNLDLTSRARLMSSLDDLAELALVERVEALARQPDRRFFHWEIEFPEVFFGFADLQERHLKHKNEMLEGSAGFDAVVGNPPYVRQETIKPFKDFLKANYETFDSTNDLYVYFQEQEICHLRAEGRMGMIVANKWMRAGYGERLRGYLMQTACPREVIDFGHSPIFPDADTFPCILLVSRRVAPLSVSERQDGEAMATCQVPREHWNDRMDLGAFVSRARYSIPTRLLRTEGWSLENPAVQALLEKIRTTGVPLSEFCGSSPLYGIKTGCNEAFVIDEATRARLIAEDQESAEVIKPLLRGRDIDRWRPRRSGMYLIFARRGIKIDRYPAIKRHLARFREQLVPRPATWTGTTDEWPGRAPGDYKWYELQASPGEEFARALDLNKLLYQVIQFHSWFCLETDCAAINDKVFALPSDDLALLGVLCSPLMWWQLTRVLPHMKDEALNPAGYMMENVRVAVGAEQAANDIRETALALLSETNRLHEWESEVFESLRRRLDVAEPDDRVFTWLTVAADTFISRLSKLAEIPRPSAALASQMSSFQQEARRRQVGLLTRQLELEKRLAALVEDAYGLTAEERALLRSTRPIRDPIDVLEARIRGSDGPGVTGSPVTGADNE